MVLGKPCVGADDGLETYNSQGLHLIENGNVKMTTIIGVLAAKAGREAERLVAPNARGVYNRFLQRPSAQQDLLVNLRRSPFEPRETCRNFPKQLNKGRRAAGRLGSQGYPHDLVRLGCDSRFLYLGRHNEAR